MGTVCIWHGDPEEAYALILAIDNNCGCTRASSGALTQLCGAHQGMTDQRFLDYILFLRHMREWLLAEEFSLL